MTVFKKGDIVKTTVWSPSPDYIVTRVSRDKSKVNVRLASDLSLLFKDVNAAVLRLTND